MYMIINGTERMKGYSDLVLVIPLQLRIIDIIVQILLIWNLKKLCLLDGIEMSRLII